MTLETQDHPLDHEEVEEQQLVDRYLLGQLPGEEARRFEVHYLSCPQCLERLELTETLLHGLRRAAAQDAAKVQSAFFVTLFRHKGLVAALAAILLLIPSGLLWQRLHERTGELNSVRGELKNLQVPQGGTSYLPLSPLRSGGEGEPSHYLRLPADPGWIVMSLELAPPLAEGYRITLFDSEEQKLWESEVLRPNNFDSLVLSFPSSFLAPGDYLLAASPTAGATLLFPFRVVPPVTS